MKQSIRNKIFINFAAFISVVICIFVVVIFWQLHKNTVEQEKLLKKELTSRTFTTVKDYHTTTQFLLHTVRQKIEDYGILISQNLPIASTIKRRQVESIVEYLQVSAKKEDIDFVLVFSDDGILLASSGGSKGYRPGDLHLPSRIESYTNFPSVQKLNTILKNEISLQVSPQESLAREKESSAHGLIKLEAEFLKTMGFDQGKVRRKSIAVWGTGIIRDEFSIPVGIYIAGKLMDDLSHFFQGLYESIDAATILYVDGTPIDFVGLDNIERENNERSLPEISQSEMEKIYDNNQPTNLILSFPPERYLSACSSLKDVEQNKIGILCSGIPESQIEKVQQPLLVHGIETQKILQRWLLVSGVILVLISILLARTIAMGITKPLENVVEFTDKLEDGDLSRRLNTSSKDEIGALSKSIDTMLDNLNIALREKEKLEGQLRQAHKMEAIGTMAGGIAHDFNNLLAVILGYTDLAKEDLPDSHPSKSSLEQVLKAGIQARDLIKQILSFSRKEAQELVAVEIHLIVKEALKLLRASIPTTIEIKPNIDTHCGYILADPSQVHQVLINLCTNASHAMEEDGGVLEVGLKRVNIDTADLAVKLHLKQGPYIVLSVKDSGIGIEDAVQDRIFDPYFTTKEVGKGSGMGLAVVVGVVKCHNGSVIVDSKPGKGTTFYVYFPRVDKEIDMEVNDSGPIPTGNERILVVDDEEHIADMTKRRLELLGYQVTTKTSSIEALDLIRARPDDFDLIITDQTMPRVTGEQLAQKIMEFRPNIPIILCTGYSSKIDAQKADAVGIKAFVMKPVDKVELAGTIRNILDNQ